MSITGSVDDDKTLNGGAKNKKNKKNNTKKLPFYTTIGCGAEDTWLWQKYRWKAENSDKRNTRIDRKVWSIIRVGVGGVDKEARLRYFHRRPLKQFKIKISSRQNKLWQVKSDAFPIIKCFYGKKRRKISLCLPGRENTMLSHWLKSWWFITHINSRALSLDTGVSIVHWSV